MTWLNLVLSSDIFSSYCDGGFMCALVLLLIASSPLSRCCRSGCFTSWKYVLFAASSPFQPSVHQAQTFLNPAKCTQWKQFFALRSVSPAHAKES